MIAAGAIALLAPQAPLLTLFVSASVAMLVIGAGSWIFFNWYQMRTFRLDPPRWRYTSTLV